MKIPALSAAAILFAALTLQDASASAPPDDVTIFVPESLTSISSEGTALSGERRGMNVSIISTTGKKIALVGRIERDGLEVEIVNNERSHITPVFHGRYFHAQVILSLGVNMLDVRFRKPGGSWKSKALSVFRSSKLNEGVSGSYPAYVFHTGVNEEHCQECHQMGLTQSEVESGMEKSCLKCHKGFTENLFVHGPVAVGICTVCHDPESTPNKYRVEEGDKVLCYGCHQDRKEIDESKKLQHGPVGAGLCTVCHDPHGSAFEYQLIKSRTEICVMCHQEDADRWMGQNSLHPPFKAGDCAGCHDPHSSDFIYNLKASRKDLCAICHELPVPGHLHEAGKRPQFNLPDDFPVTDDGQTMCLSCHDPHGARGAHLTRRDGCDGCHPK